MEINGKIIAVLPLKSGISQSSGKTWMTQDYVLETVEEYPKRVCFNVFGEDRIKEAAIQVGMEVKIQIEIDAREYQGKWYNQVRAWKIENVGPAPMPAAPDGNPFEDQDDNLPF